MEVGHVVMILNVFYINRILDFGQTVEAFHPFQNKRIRERYGLEITFEVRMINRIKPNSRRK